MRVNEDAQIFVGCGLFFLLLAATFALVYWIVHVI